MVSSKQPKFGLMQELSVSRISESRGSDWTVISLPMALCKVSHDWSNSEWHKMIE